MRLIRTLQVTHAISGLGKFFENRLDLVMSQSHTLPKMVYITLVIGEPSASLVF
jgi:hypothetical protein